MVAEYWWNTKIFFQEILLIRFVRNILFWKRNKKVLEDRDSRSCRHVSWFLLHHRETGGVIAHFQPTSSGKPSSILLFASPGRGLLCLHIIFRCFWLSLSTTTVWCIYSLVHLVVAKLEELISRTFLSGSIQDLIVAVPGPCEVTEF